MSENIIENKINKLFADIDKIIKRGVKLKYENYTFLEDENAYRVNVILNKNGNSKNKIKYMTKLEITKYILWDNDNLIFNVEFPVNDEIDLMKLKEHDSAESVWDFYYCRYGEMLKDKKLTINGKEIDVHGEVDFNFGYQKVEDFKMIVDRDTKASAEMKNLANELLNLCSYFNYSLLNMSIMPSVGNMQGTKESIGCDRSDVFVWALNLYYNENIDLVVNSKTTAQNMQELIENLEAVKRLKSFSNSYINYLYDITDEKLINSLIQSGKKKIDSTVRVIEYIVLAYNVWRTRNNVFIHNQCKNKYYELDGEDVYFAFMEYFSELECLGYNLIINS